METPTRAALPNPRRLKRRWWQVLLRGGLAVVLMLCALYVVLPWILPTETLRQYLRASLAEQLGGDVSVGAMHISWGEGVVIDGLTITNPPEFPPGPMVRVGRIRCDFSPLRLLFGRRITWMDVEQLVVTVKDNQAGRLNIDCLKNLKMDIETRRLRVRESRFSVFLQDQPRPLVAQISDLQVLRSREILGQITMTGAFEQTGAPAPIALRISVGGPEEHAATVDCRFANLDLKQLPRSQAVWRDLPIESLDGRCRGQLVFQMGRNLRMEEVRLELLAENLVVKPHGLAALPTIEKAGLQLDADLDALAERADVRQFHLRVPGVQLAGSGVFYADLLQGDWQAVERLQLRGSIYPERLLALMTGRETLPNHLAVRGPIEIHALAQHVNDMLGVDLDIDAGATGIRTEQTVLKPAEQPLRLQLQAGLRRTGDACRLDVNHAQFLFGENRITAAGRIADLQAFTPSQSSEDPDRALNAILRALRQVRLRGDVHLKYPPSLLAGVPNASPESLPLRGTWVGPWSFSPGAKPKFTLGLRGDASVESRPDDPTRPKEQEFSLELSASLDPEARKITDILLDALSDRGRVSLDACSVQLPVGKHPLRWEGEFEIDRIESFRAWIAPDPKKPSRISGGAKGSFRGSVSRAGKMQSQLDANLDALGLSLGKDFSKLPGETTRVHFDATGDLHEDSWKASIRVRFQEATFQMDSRQQDGVVTLQTRADIQDVAWLQTVNPSLDFALGGGRLNGPLQVEGSLRRDGPNLSYALKAESKALDCVVGGQRPTVNIQDKHVILALRGTAHETSADELPFRNEETSLVVGDSSISMTELQGRLNRKRLRTALKTGKPWEACDEWKAQLHIQCDVGDLLGEVVPRWASWAARHRLEGKVHTRGSVHMDRKNLSAQLHVDAADLGVRDVEGFTKTRGEPVLARLEVSTPPDFTAPRIRAFHLETQAVTVDANVEGQTRLDEGGLPIGIAPAEVSLTAKLQDAGALARFWPAWKDRNLRGRASLQLRWTAEPNRWGTIRELALGVEDLRGTWREKSCRLDGDVRIENLSFVDESTPTLGRLTTENLEFAAGDNRGWLLADVRVKPGAPAGEFHVLFASLDDKDLADWLANPASAPTSQPSSRTDADAALRQRADRWIARAHDWFKNADLTGRVSAARYRTYDPNVRQYYPARELELRLRIRDNDLRLGYDAGLYGGRVTGSLATNLTVPQPVVTSKTEYADVKATKTIRPQISRMFPGNTVHGKFNRTENVHFPLRDLLCNAADSGYRLCPEGDAELVATDGVVLGKAAPDFVTNIFPGLNLTKYPYRTMTAFTKFLPDGATQNETFFFGAYDLYMEGTTKRDNSIRYMVGLVLLGGAFPAEALRDWKQGRVPILKVKGRIEDGKLVDDTVSYPLPNETLFEIFLKNNLVYRAWVNLHNPPPGK
ncbi:MAG: hypothetical protein JXA11_03750 [Phycisphaerae bacterium]|nr:hypothetical protein [Phycisphaerae bacterium]